MIFRLLSPVSFYLVLVSVLVLSLAWGEGRFAIDTAPLALQWSIIFGLLSIRYATAQEKSVVCYGSFVQILHALLALNIIVWLAGMGQDPKTAQPGGFYCGAVIALAVIIAHLIMFPAYCVLPSSGAVGNGIFAVILPPLFWWCRFVYSSTTFPSLQNFGPAIAELAIISGLTYLLLRPIESRRSGSRKARGVLIMVLLVIANGYFVFHDQCR